MARDLPRNLRVHRALFLRGPPSRVRMKAVVRLLPGPGDLSNAMGAQMAQALGAFGAPAGGRIPVAVPTDEERVVIVEDAARSVNDAHVLRVLDEEGRERAAFPLHRVDYVRFE